MVCSAAFEAQVVRQSKQFSRANLPVAREERPGAARSLCPSRLHAAQPDAERSESGRAGLPGRGARADHLRHGVAAARCLCQLGRGTGARLERAGLPVETGFAEFWRAFEWMGLQRHLKVLGIFARINYRDGKPKYLADTPRFIGYARAVSKRYAALAPLAGL